MGRSRRGAATLAVLLLAAAACAGRSDVTDRLDWRLEELAATRPDTIVGVLVRTNVPPDSAQRAALVDAGLAIGTVAGTILTGRLRAGEAGTVARLSFIVRIELARRRTVH